MCLPLIMAALLAMVALSTASVVDSCNLAVIRSFPVDDTTKLQDGVAAPTTSLWFRFNHVQRNTSIETMRVELSFNTTTATTDLLTTGLAAGFAAGDRCSFLKFSRPGDSLAEISTKWTSSNSTLVFDLYEANADAADSSVYIKCPIPISGSLFTSDHVTSIYPHGAVPMTLETTKTDNITTSTTLVCAVDTRVVELRDAIIPYFGLSKTLDFGATPAASKYTVTVRTPPNPKGIDYQLDDGTTLATTLTGLSLTELETVKIVDHGNTYTSVYKWFEDNQHANDEAATIVSPLTAIRCETGFSCIGFQPSRYNEKNIYTKSVVLTQLVMLTAPLNTLDFTPTNINEPLSEFRIDVSVSLIPTAQTTVLTKLQGFECRLHNGNYSTTDIVAKNKTASLDEIITGDVSGIEVYNYDSELPVELVCVVYFEEEVTSYLGSYFNLKWTWNKHYSTEPGYDLNLNSTIVHEDVTNPLQKLSFIGNDLVLSTTPLTSATADLHLYFVEAAAIVDATCVLHYGGIIRNAPNTNLAAGFQVLGYAVGCGSAPTVDNTRVSAPFNSYGEQTISQLSYISGSLFSGFNWARFSIRIYRDFQSTVYVKPTFSFEMPAGIELDENQCVAQDDATTTLVIEVKDRVVTIELANVANPYVTFACDKVHVDSSRFSAQKYTVMDIFYGESSPASFKPMNYFTSLMWINEVHSLRNDDPQVLLDDITLVEDATVGLLTGNMASSRFFYNATNKLISFESNFVVMNSTSNYLIELPLSTIGFSITFNKCSLHSSSLSVELTGNPTWTDADFSTTAASYPVVSIPTTSFTVGASVQLRCAEIGGFTDVEAYVAQPSRVGSDFVDPLNYQMGIFHAYTKTVKIDLDNYSYNAAIDKIEDVSFTISGLGSDAADLLLSIREYDESNLTETVDLVAGTVSNTERFGGLTVAAADSTATLGAAFGITQLSVSKYENGVFLIDTPFSGRAAVPLKSYLMPYWVHLDILHKDGVSRIASARFLINYSPTIVVPGYENGAVSGGGVTPAPVYDCDKPGYLMSAWSKIGVVGSSDVFTYFSNDVSIYYDDSTTSPSYLKDADSFFSMCNTGSNYTTDYASSYNMSGSAAVLGGVLYGVTDLATIGVVETLDNHLRFDLGVYTEMFTIEGVASSDYIVLIYDTYDATHVNKDILVDGLECMVKRNNDDVAPMMGNTFGAYFVTLDLNPDTISLKCISARNYYVRVFDIAHGAYIASFQITPSVVYTVEPMPSKENYASLPQWTGTELTASYLLAGVVTPFHVHLKEILTYDTTYTLVPTDGCTVDASLPNVTVTVKAGEQYSATFSVTCENPADPTTQTHLEFTSTDNNQPVDHDYPVYATCGAIPTGAILPDNLSVTVPSILSADPSISTVHFYCTNVDNYFIGAKALECNAGNTDVNMRSWADVLAKAVTDAQAACVPKTCSVAKFPTAIAAYDYTVAFDVTVPDVAMSASEMYLYSATFTCPEGLVFKDGNEKTKKIICASDEKGNTEWRALGSTWGSDLFAERCVPENNACFGFVPKDTLPGSGLYRFNNVTGTNDTAYYSGFTNVNSSPVPLTTTNGFVSYDAVSTNEGKSTYTYNTDGTRSTVNYRFQTYDVLTVATLMCNEGYEYSAGAITTAKCSAGAWDVSFTAEACVASEKTCAISDLSALGLNVTGSLERVPLGEVIKGSYACTNPAKSFIPELFVCGTNAKFVNVYTGAEASIDHVCTATASCSFGAALPVYTGADIATWGNAVVGSGATLDSQIAHSQVVHGALVDVDCSIPHHTLTGRLPICINGNVLYSSEAMCSGVACGVPTGMTLDSTSGSGCAAHANGTLFCPASETVPYLLRCINTPKHLTLNQAVSASAVCSPVTQTWSTLPKCTAVGCKISDLPVQHVNVDVTSVDIAGVAYGVDFNDQDIVSYGTVIEASCLSNYVFDGPADPSMTSLKYECVATPVTTQNDVSAIVSTGTWKSTELDYIGTCKLAACSMRTLWAQFNASTAMYLDNSYTLRQPLLIYDTDVIVREIIDNGLTASNDVLIPRGGRVTLTCPDAAVPNPGSTIECVGEVLTAAANYGYNDLSNPCQSYCHNKDLIDFAGSASKVLEDDGTQTAIDSTSGFGIGASVDLTCATDNEIRPYGRAVVQALCGSDRKWSVEGTPIGAAKITCAPTTECVFLDTNNHKLDWDETTGALTCFSDLLTGESFEFTAASARFASCNNKVANYTTPLGITATPECERVTCPSLKDTFPSFATSSLTKGVDVNTDVKLTCGSGKTMYNLAILYNGLPTPVANNEITVTCTKAASTADAWSAGSVDLTKLTCGAESIMTCDALSPTNTVSFDTSAEIDDGFAQIQVRDIVGTGVYSAWRPLDVANDPMFTTAQQIRPACAADLHAPIDVIVGCRMEVNVTTGAYLLEAQTYYVSGTVAADTKLCAPRICEFVKPAGSVVEVFNEYQDNSNHEYGTFARVSCSAANERIKVTTGSVNSYVKSVIYDCTNPGIADIDCENRCTRTTLEQFYTDNNITVAEMPAYPEFDGANPAIPEFTVVQMTCDDNVPVSDGAYKLNAGAVRCDADNGWTSMAADGKLPVCFQAPCAASALPLAQHPYVDAVNANATQFNHGDEVVLTCPVGYTGSTDITAECAYGQWYVDNALLGAGFPSLCVKTLVSAGSVFELTGHSTDSNLVFELTFPSSNSNLYVDSVTASPSYDNCLKAMAFASLAKFGKSQNVQCKFTPTGLTVWTGDDSTVLLGETIYFLDNAFSLESSPAVFADAFSLSLESTGLFGPNASLRNIVTGENVNPVGDLYVSQCTQFGFELVFNTPVHNYTRAWGLDTVSRYEPRYHSSQSIDVVSLKVTSWIGKSKEFTKNIELVKEQPSFLVFDGPNEEFTIQAGEALTVARFPQLSKCGPAHGGILTHTVEAATIGGIALTTFPQIKFADGGFVIPSNVLVVPGTYTIQITTTESYPGTNIVSSDATTTFSVTVETGSDVTVITQNIPYQGRVWTHNVYDWDSKLSIDGSNSFDSKVISTAADDRLHFRWECKFKATNPTATDLPVNSNFDNSQDSWDDCGLDYVNINSQNSYDAVNMDTSVLEVSNRFLVRLFDFDRHSEVNLFFRLRVTKNVNNNLQNAVSRITRVQLVNTVAVAGYSVPTFVMNGIDYTPYSATIPMVLPNLENIGNITDVQFMKASGQIKNAITSGGLVATLSNNYVVRYFDDSDVVLEAVVSVPQNDYSSVWICPDVDLAVAATTSLFNTDRLVLRGSYFGEANKLNAQLRCTYVIFPKQDISAYENLRDIYNTAKANKWYHASATLLFRVVKPVNVKDLELEYEYLGMYKNSMIYAIVVGATGYTRFTTTMNGATTTLFNGNRNVWCGPLSRGVQTISAEVTTSKTTDLTNRFITLRKSISIDVVNGTVINSSAAGASALSGVADAIAQNDAYAFASSIPASLSAATDVANATAVRAAYLEAIVSHAALFGQAESSGTAVANVEGSQLAVSAIANVLSAPKQTTPDTIATSLRLQGTHLKTIARSGSSSTGSVVTTALSTLANALAAANTHDDVQTSAVVVDSIVQQLGPIVATAIRSAISPATAATPVSLSSGPISVTAFAATPAEAIAAFSGAGFEDKTVSADLFEQFENNNVNKFYVASYKITDNVAIANAGAAVPITKVSQLTGLAFYSTTGVKLDTSSFKRARITVPHVGGFPDADSEFPACQYFVEGSSDSTIESESDAWGSSGCSLYKRHDDYTVCECSHLTAFRARADYGSDAWLTVNNSNVKDNMTPLYVVFVWMAVFVIFVLIAKAIDNSKSGEAIKMLLIQWHSDAELGTAAASTARTDNQFSRTSTLMSANQLFYSVFARSSYDNVSSATRMAVAMLVALTGFTLTAMFWGGMKTRNSLDNYPGVIFLAAGLLVIVNIIFANVLRMSHSSGPKAFLYKYALELAALYHTGTSTYFPASEQASLKAGANHNYRGVYQNILAEEKKGNTSTVHSLLRSAVVLDKKHVQKTLSDKGYGSSGASIAAGFFFFAYAVACAILIVAFGIQLGTTVTASVGKWIGSGFAAVAIELFIFSPIFFFLAATLTSSGAPADVAARGLTAYHMDSFEEYVETANKTYTPYVAAVAVSTQAVETQPLASGAASAAHHDEEGATDAEAVAVEVVATEDAVSAA